jgi:hypothetical protein
MYGTEKA